MIAEYENYHKHDRVSNIFTPDSHIFTIDYINRIKELGYGCYFTTNHGTGGDVFESLSLCRKHDIRCIFGVEGYIVENPYEKDSRNYHIVIIPKDNVARKKVNLILSRANMEGYYYKPRIFIEDLLKLNPDDVFITTACVAGILRDKNAILNIFMPLMKHFGKNLFLEVQNHNEINQKIINKTCLKLADKFNLELIAANDSHYIYPEQAKDRLEFLKGKGMNYGDEDTYILDYPDYDTFYNRFMKQGVLSPLQIETAIRNTLIFRNCEDINIDYSIKMPSIYPNLSADEKIVELKSHVSKRFKEIIKTDEITAEELPIYKQGIREEMKVIEQTKEINTADYFLFNEKLVDLAVNKYKGVLTRTGRGSCGAFYINKILGMTQLDRFRLDIKLYPERFMSTARLLENRALPDIDFNVVSQEPFVKAAKELLGEHGCYPMIAYGTMQMGEAFRNVCRTHDLPYDEYNEVAKNIEDYAENKKWKPYIEEAKKYIDVIVSVSPHPCAHVLDNKDLREEYGVVKIGDSFCVMVTSSEADEFKMLKDDFLIVTVYKLIDETFKLIGKPIITVKELLDSIKDDKRIWDIFAKELTCTLNQVDGDWATSLLKSFKPKNYSDMAMFVACLRPFFNAWRDGFIAREDFTTGSTYLDEVLSSTNGYILFQENLMQYFEWLGVTPAESIGLIKKISKKKIKPEDFKNLEERIKTTWLKNTGSMDAFDTTWEMIQGCMSYGFASPHAVATAIDCLYGAYLKVHYPLEYYTVALTVYSGDLKRTNKLNNELSHFGITLYPIKFGKSSAKYTIDKEHNAIYKGIGSIKYCNEQMAEELFKLSQSKKFKDFVELLNCISDKENKISINIKQLKILISLNYFSDFGRSAYLLRIVDLYFGVKMTVGVKSTPKTVLPSILTCSQINKEKLREPDKDRNKGLPAYEDYGVTECIVRQYSNKETAKQYREIDNKGLLKALIKNIPNKSLHIQEYVRAEIEYLDYSTYKDNKSEENLYIVVSYTTYKSDTKPYIVVHNLRTGEEVSTKISQSKVYKQNPFGLYSILKINKFDNKNKRKLVNDKWVEVEETEQVLTEYEVVKR